MPDRLDPTILPGCKSPIITRGTKQRVRVQGKEESSEAQNGFSIESKS